MPNAEIQYAGILCGKRLALSLRRSTNFLKNRIMKQMQIQEVGLYQISGS